MLFWLNDSRTIDPDAGPRSTHLALAISISILCCWFVVPSHCLGDETNATVVKDFLCPWVDTVPQSTTFACWLDQDRFHFRFTVKDDDVVLQENWDGENTLEREDRVAFAVSNDQEFGQLYCLELDAKGRVRDFKRDIHQKIDTSWTCDGLVAKSQSTEEGYIVSASIPIATLSSLSKQSIDANAMILAGLIRTDHSSTSKSATWSSWQLPSTSSDSPYVRSSVNLMPVQGGRFLNPSESARARTLRIARDKVRRNWHEHLQRNTTKEKAERWFDSLADFPSIPESWMILETTSLPVASAQPLEWDDTSKETLSYRPFSISMTLDKSNSTSNKRGDGRVLLELIETKVGQKIRIRCESGRVWFDMAASNAEKSMSVATIDEIMVSSGDSVTVTSEGTGSAQDLAIYINGKRRNTLTVSEHQPQTIPMRPVIETGQSWSLNTFQTSLRMFQLRNHVLSPLEIQSLDDSVRLLTWGEQTEEDHIMLVDHYARRIDTEGGYLLESLRHYR